MGQVDGFGEGATDNFGDAGGSLQDEMSDRLDAALTGSSVDIPPLPDMPPLPSFDPEPFTTSDLPFSDDTDEHKRDLPPPPFSS